jgi:hypothetical protein
LHKNFIKYCTAIVKSKNPENYQYLIAEHDKQDKDKKASKIFREYACAAYNCLIMLFVSTQSNKEHFKSFLFEHNRQAFWDNLVDTEQTDFGFQIETEFKVMKPYNPLRNKVKEVRARI